MSYVQACIRKPLPFSPCFFSCFGQLAISSHENATPVKLLHNSAGHLNGPARSIGAALIGYLGELST